MIIFITQIIGLRSCAKFTVYDFANTVAIGSIISSTLTSSTSVAQGFTAIAGFLTLTYLFSALQRKFKALYSVISNKPLLLMDGADIIHSNLQTARIHEGQLIAKLREANVFNFSQVIAVVMETTGDISVLHRSNRENDEFEDRILQGVFKSDRS